MACVLQHTAAFCNEMEQDAVLYKNNKRYKLSDKLHQNTLSSIKHFVSTLTIYFNNFVTNGDGVKFFGKLLNAFGL